MIIYFIKLAYRNFKRNWIFSMINILGLGIALASCILIYEYVSKEWSYDKFHTNYERIFRIQQTTETSDQQKRESATTFSAVATELNTSYASIESFTRIHIPPGDAVLQYEDKFFREEGLLGVDTSFFDIFNFAFKYGNATTALNYNNAVVLTEIVAKKYFGDSNPVGKEIEIEGAYGYYENGRYVRRSTHVVGGVLEELPSNTHLKFDVLISLNLYYNLEQQLSNWGDSFYTYVKLKNLSKQPYIAEELDAIVTKYRSDNNMKLELQRMQAIHLASNLTNEIALNGSESLTWIITIIAVLILVIASTNYVNFSIARSIDRTKEVGIRKIYWANSTQLFFQLLIESFLINAFALLAACLLIIVTQPILADLLEIDLLQKLYNLQFQILLFGLLVIGTLFSGFYPAFYISRLQVDNALNNAIKKPKGQLRKVLVTFQFACSVLAIGSTLILYQQMNFMKSKDLGIDIDKTLVINGPNINTGNDSIYNSKVNTFKIEANKLSGIDGVTLANFIPGKEIRGKARGYVRRLGVNEDQAGTYAFSQVDLDFLPSFNIEVLAGRTFNKSSGSDLNFKNSVIINKEASELLGFSTPEEALGEKIYYRINSTPTIIGVVDNFHQYAMDQRYQPIIFEGKIDPEKYYYLKLSEKINHSSLLNLQSIWSNNFPGNPFNYFYLDQYYNRQYERDDLFMKAFVLFAGLSILVATIGFFGLIYYTASSKVQEIGIRKILGAERWDISIFLSKDISIMICLATIISLPILYYFSSNWLLNYAFKIDLVWWMFVIPILLLVAIAAMVIIVQTLRVYNINPSITLKEE
ncbi:putative ABC transport system permease protein [Marivirga sericea]|uniref:Putative ABC transport system permease protein n=1 Tax=Marivirga sericea TaxID=1028 RepID=A0A1X7I1E1_9BACT|nr:ABC transporter permease [Marivirga sericea]SMG08128.1 putative ABC transport system permease protein [Marivirga sericea]